MTEERYLCNTCGAVFTAGGKEGEIDCTECGSVEIERFVEGLYASEVEYVEKLARGAGKAEKEGAMQEDRGDRCNDTEIGQRYVCRKCGLEFSAIPGAEEPPDCPECASSESERLERATYGGTTDELAQNKKKS